MNEKQLTIEQVRTVLGISYPTALSFANEHGKMVDGRWLIPASAVQEVVDAYIAKAQKMQMRLTQEQPA